MEIPRLCRGGSSSLTFQGVLRPGSVVSSHSHERNRTDGRVRDGKPHDVGLQISRGFHPKYRRKVLYQELRKALGEVFRQLAAQKEAKVEEGHLLPDHVHMLLSIPPKYAVSNVVGYIKGKSAIHLARVYGERKRNFVGQSFWARGYCVSTVGRDEKAIRVPPEPREKEDQRLEQLKLWK
jgi:putative transposase